MKPGEQHREKSAPCVHAGRPTEGAADLWSSDVRASPRVGTLLATLAGGRWRAGSQQARPRVGVGRPLLAGLGSTMHAARSWCPFLLWAAANARQALLLPTLPCHSGLAHANGG